MQQLHSQIDEAVAAIRRQWKKSAHAGIILGTGLGGLVDQVEVDHSLPYQSIPHFPKSTAMGHAGNLILGELAGLPIVAMEGRFHAYEGYTHEQITFPVRVMKALGAGLLIVSNACGGLNESFARGDIMVIDDHINLMLGNPLIGVNDDRLGPRFPDMCAPYDPVLIDRVEQIGQREKIPIQRGVYVAVTGPNLETRAEYRFLRRIGADAVGMSTVPEVLVAVHSGMRSVGLSIVTDMCLPDALQPVNIDEILAVAAEAEPKLRKIVVGILAEERVQDIHARSASE